MPVAYSEPLEKEEFVLHVAYEAFRGLMRFHNHWGHQDFYKLDLSLQKKLVAAVDAAVRGDKPNPVWNGSWSQDDAWDLFIDMSRKMATLIGYTVK